MTHSSSSASGHGMILSWVRRERELAGERDDEHGVGDEGDDGGGVEDVVVVEGGVGAMVAAAVDGELERVDDVGGEEEEEGG